VAIFLRGRAGALPVDGEGSASTRILFSLSSRSHPGIALSVESQVRNFLRLKFIGMPLVALPHGSISAAKVGPEECRGAPDLVVVLR
jgi:hypothetical protein